VKVSVRDHIPGLMVTALAALASAYLSSRYGAPITLMALLIGLALNFMSADKRLTPGLAFASRVLLRFGIVLFGARVTLAQVADLGPVALAAILILVTLTILAGVASSRWLGLGNAFGALAGGAVAICGASAAMALATVLGERRVSQAQLTLVLVGISAMSALAMVVYPILAHYLGFNDTQAGFLTGAAIHDVAQSLGAGYSFSQGAGQAASIVKLTRVALLAPALAAVGWAFAREGGGAKGAYEVPWFVGGFFLLAAFNSAGLVPTAVGHFASDVGGGLLVCAVAATGIRSPMQSLMKTGLRPLLVIAFASLVALGFAILVAALLMR
jgi:uncharacterized integral membrane protein (TIGR00698 family)